MFAASKTDGLSELSDPQFNYVTMLLHGDGTNGAQNNTFLDSSTNNFTITRNGNTTQGSFSPYGSNWSNFFDGTGDYLSIASNSTFATTSGYTMTYEAWVYPTRIDTEMAIFSRQRTTSPYTGYVLSIRYGYPAIDSVGTSGTSGALDGSTLVTANQWNYIVWQFDHDGNQSIYLNGTRIANATGRAVNPSFTIALNIGMYNDNSSLSLYGYVSNARFIKQTTAYYSGTTITVPTSPLSAVTNTQLLTCQSNRFIDNSANAFTLTSAGNTSVQRFNPFGASTAYSTSVIGGSGYFDGSGDYLQIANNTALDVGTGAFTLEGWMYRTSLSFSDWRMFGPSTGNGGFFGGRAGKLGLGRSAIAWDLESSTNVYNNDAWTHVVYVRNGSGNLSIFSNGIRVATTTNSNNYGLGGANLQIGAEKNSELFGGFLSNTRLVKGTAVYDPTQTTLTVPNAPLTAVSGTGYLGFFTNGAIFDNAMMNDLETVGNAQISTSVVKYGTGSMAFDGTGDYLIGQVSPNLSFGTGNFTIEGWAYVTNTGTTFQCMLSIGAPVQIYARSGTIKIYFNDTDDTTTYIVNGAEGPASSVSPNTWFHFAVVRNGTTFSAYVNGVAGTPTTGISDQVALSANPISLGIYGATSTLPFTGYMDDIRITKGYARYTANFTPPTAAFPNIGPY